MQLIDDSYTHDPWNCSCLGYIERNGVVQTTLRKCGATREEKWLTPPQVTKVGPP
jgi:hypothetical protein